MNAVKSKRRMEENESVFRRKNEEVAQGLLKLKDIAQSEGHDRYLGDLDSPLLFYCECSDEDCRQRIKIKPSEYANIHTKRDKFIVLPDHAVASIEKITKKTKDYHVVKKHHAPPENPEGLQPTDIKNT